MRKLSRGSALTSALALVALGLAPVAAQASRASVEGALITYLAGPGEANRVTVGPEAALRGGLGAPGVVVVDIQDLGAVILPGPGCQSVDDHTARCVAVSDTVVPGPTMDMLLGDEADEADVLAPIPPDIAGGPGDDDLHGVVGTDAFLTGGDGNDVLTFDAGDHTNLCGEAGDDILNGSPRHDHVLGGPGNDVLNAGGGEDGLVGGGDGENPIGGGPSCGPLTDPDQSGPDGDDVFLGGDAGDLIDSRDGRREQVSCGAGDELLVTVDVSDVVSDDCEPAAVKRGFK